MFNEHVLLQVSVTRTVIKLISKTNNNTNRTLDWCIIWSGKILIRPWSITWPCHLPDWLGLTWHIFLRLWFSLIFQISRIQLQTRPKKIRQLWGIGKYPNQFPIILVLLIMKKERNKLANWSKPPSRNLDKTKQWFTLAEPLLSVLGYFVIMK